jgi:acyl transferase domain-containing protein
VNQVFEIISLQAKKVHKIIYLWALEAISNDEISAQELVLQQEVLTKHAMYMLKAVVSSQIEPSIYIVTQGVEAISAQEMINFNQAAIYGIGRVMKNEYPFIPLSLIDISQTCTDPEIDNLYMECTSKAISITELALRGSKRYMRKLEAVTAQIAESTAVNKFPLLIILSRQL